jgi:putative glutathione S-transferase
MGALVDGTWTYLVRDTHSESGHYVRKESEFRAQISDDPAAPHPAALGRYHLYASLACPWAHRALIFRKLKGLEAMIHVSLVEPLMLDHGWQFSERYPDALHGAHYLHELYTRADPLYSGRVTVPVLWDKEKGTIVNNESSEIIRMLNSAFDTLGARPGDYYPNALRPEIDEVNARVYDSVNNGVYKAGFAKTQTAYREAVHALFDTLDWLEQRLAHARYLVGEQLTEADIRLFTTLLRFDAVYYGHFKCNLRQIKDYPELRALRRRIYELPGVAETVDIEYTKQHYYGSHRHLNPTGVIPEGPRDWL